MEKLYHVVVIHERTGAKYYMTSKPLPHSDAVVLLNKITKYPWRRSQLEEVK